MVRIIRRWSNCAIPIPRSPVKGLRLILDDQALGHLRQRLEVALEQCLDEVASLVLGVALGDVHHERLYHQRPRPAVDDLRVNGEDGGVVLEEDGTSRSVSGSAPEAGDFQPTRPACSADNSHKQCLPLYVQVHRMHVTMATLGACITEESKRMDHDKGSVTGPHATHLSCKVKGWRVRAMLVNPSS
jgi:hypothetical protein